MPRRQVADYFRPIAQAGETEVTLRDHIERRRKDLPPIVRLLP
jgi:hypothetical protein